MVGFAMCLWYSRVCLIVATCIHINRTITTSYLLPPSAQSTLSNTRPIHNPNLHNAHHLLTRTHPAPPRRARAGHGAPVKRPHHSCGSQEQGACAGACVCGARFCAKPRRGRRRERGGCCSTRRDWRCGGGAGEEGRRAWWRGTRWGCTIWGGGPWCRAQERGYGSGSRDWDGD